MDLHKHGQAGAGGERIHVFQLGIRQNGGDEQDGIGAPFGGLQDLALVDDEIFA